MYHFDKSHLRVVFIHLVVFVFDLVFSAFRRSSSFFNSWSAFSSHWAAVCGTKFLRELNFADGRFSVWFFFLYFAGINFCDWAKRLVFLAGN